MSRHSCGTHLLPAIFAWGFFLILTAIFFLFPCRYILVEWGDTGVALAIYDTILSLFAFVHLLAATFVDPGRYPKAEQHEIEQADTRITLHRNMDISGVTFRLKWCTTCQFFRPPRCSHCSACDMCIDTFDHHCPWVNNCIGRRNYRFFVLFLLSLWVHMISVLAISIAAISLWRAKHAGYLGGATPILSIIECLFVCLFLIPVTGLSAFHIFLISAGRSTNEQVTGKVKADFNPFTRGCLLNWAFLFWGPQYPRLLDRTKLADMMNKVVLTKPAETSVDDVTVLVDNAAGDSAECKLLFTQSMADDTKSVASSVISDFRITQRLVNRDKFKGTASTNNLIRDDVNPSLSDYYITNEGSSECSSRDDAHKDSAKLLMSSPQEVPTSEINGHKRESAEGEVCSETDESAALLERDSHPITNSVVTSM